MVKQEQENTSNTRKQADGKMPEQAQSGKTSKRISAQTPKPISAFGSDELAEAVFFFAGALDEIVDMVFIADTDPEFLTTERVRELQTLQTMAQLIRETAAIQILNNKPKNIQTVKPNNAGHIL